MRLQSRILQTLRTPEARARLAPIVAQGACESRAALGREVCAQFGFVDARGSAQPTGWLKALEVLETEQQIALPAPMGIGPRPGASMRPCPPRSSPVAGGDLRRARARWRVLPGGELRVRRPHPASHHAD